VGGIGVDLQRIFIRAKKASTAEGGNTDACLTSDAVHRKETAFNLAEQMPRGRLNNNVIVERRATAGAAYFQVAAFLPVEFPRRG
jgi:hypothetical protein